MAKKTSRGDRRTDGLSRERIVQVAIELLDAEGDAGLTFRALAERLATGAGAIYWHVPNKGVLLAATTDDVVTKVLEGLDRGGKPKAAIRAVALGLFDAIDAHPWVGAQLAREPDQPAMTQIYERVGAQLLALRVPDEALFFTASTLVGYILGVATQNAANARNPVHGGDRDGHLAAIAARWSALDPEKHPFMRRMAEQVRGHEDREQFLAGIDLIVAGIGSLR
jgi:AcrR family transcriptional regulator